MRFAAAITLVLSLGACGDPPSVDGDAGPDGSDGGAYPTADELYTPDRVYDLHIRLSDTSVDNLKDTPREYTLGEVEFAGLTWQNVGVRLKGTFSFRAFGDKAAFKLKFDWLDDRGRFLGLKSLSLNNMWQDRALVHEQVGYRAFRAAGVGAPRSGYIRLTVNDELYGLYANIESIGDDFLERVFDDGSGSLYEGEFGTDLYPDDVWEFEQDEGDDTSRTDLSELIDMANLPGDDIFFADDTVLDTDAFLAFVITEIALGHWDGYYRSHNYRIYHQPTTDKWYWIPWGLDQVLEREIDLWTSMSMLTQKCFTEPTCVERYAQVAEQVAADYEALGLDEWVDELAAVVDDAADEDPKKPYVMDKYYRHQDEVKAMVLSAPDRLRMRAGCVVDGAEVDADDDGWGACFADCDDTSDQAHPGGAEVCDGLDNDCDGYVDELDTCPCDSMVLDGDVVLLCDNARPWTMARTYCSAQGGRLAWIESATENEQLYGATQLLSPGFWYIGYNDRTDEGEWKWDGDDDEGDYENFAPGDPDDFGNEDCAVVDPYAAGAWTDQRCQFAHPFACRIDN